MPLGTRDVLLIIRAKDQASRVIQSVGKSFGTLDSDARAAGAATMQQGLALVGMGIGVAAVGAAGVVALNNWRQAAVDYNKQAALTLTQVDQAGVSVEDIGRIGLDVAKKIPAPLQELQAGLYDIFSSMDVSVLDSQKILEGFAKTAVAGQVDVQTAGRQTIAVMNGFNLTTADLGRIQDINFQLVRKGVGTYDDFASNIGKAIPSAARASQSYESLAGMMAFLTRNGLSASMAATSSARAFDNIDNPKVIKHFQELGINVADSTGKFRPMVEIVGELDQKLGPLTDVQRAAALDKLFKGGGNNIQARRFWDLAIKDFESLNGLTGDMINSSGALDAAYDIMFNQPASQAQLLQNNLDALRIELGQLVIPAFNWLVEKALIAIRWFDGLSDGTKKLVVQLLAGAAAFFLIAGFAMIFVGSIKAIMGAFQMIGGLGALLTKLNPWVLLIIALAAAAIYVYKNWDKFKPYWEKLWAFAKDKAEAFLDWFMPLWKKYWPEILATAQKVWEWLKSAWKTVVAAFQTTVVWFQTTFIPAMKTVWDMLQKAAQGVADWFADVFGPGIMKIWSAIRDNAGPIFTAIGDIISSVWGIVRTATETVWPIIKTIIFDVLPPIWELIKTTLGDILTIMTNVWDNVKGVIKAAWDFIAGLIAAGIQILRGILEFLAGVFTLDWDRAWNGIKTIVEGIWNAIWTFATTTWDGIRNVIGGGWDILTGALKLIWDTITGDANIAWEFIKSIASLIWGGIQNAISVPIDALKAILQGVWDALKLAAGIAWDAIKAVIEPIINAIIAIIDGFVSAVQTAIDIFKQFIGLGDSAPGTVGGVPGIGPGGPLRNVGGRFVQGAMGINFHEGGWALVGERGPELLRLPRASQVMTTLRSQQMLTPTGTPFGSTDSTQQIGMWIEHATFNDHVDVTAAQQQTRAQLATMGVV